MDAASRRFRDNQSFSSTLLDEIYRSIDEQTTVCTESVRKKQSKFGGSKSRSGCFDDYHHRDDERRACLMQKWMDNKVRQKPVVGRRSAADLERSSMRYERELFCFNSSSSSCVSCCCCGVSGRGFSSSESETVYGGLFKHKPIRTGVCERDQIIKREKQRIVCRHEESQTESKHEGKFLKTKSKALKIYSDLKKVKQPISPGGRISTFLNSLFTTGNNKKPNTCSTTKTVVGGGYSEAARSQLDRKSKSANASTCSSASSFSRSCLSNTTASSRGKPSNGTKRSVRFYPVSVLVDRDCQPCGHKSLHEEETNFNSIKFAQNSINKENLSDKSRHVSEAARNLLKKYQKKVNSSRINEYEQQFDDGGSDSSSDLFELDHLSAIGIDKYREELPVYETTQLDTNRLFM